MIPAEKKIMINSKRMDLLRLLFMVVRPPIGGLFF
jgi:hypothetical protein